jgi:hypothetical protein
VSRFSFGVGVMRSLLYCVFIAAAATAVPVSAAEVRLPPPSSVGKLIVFQGKLEIGGEKTIVPPANKFEFFRWQTQSILFTDYSFIEFLLWRIIETLAINPSPMLSDTGADWNEAMIFEIGPLPELSEIQPEVTSLDFVKRDFKANVSVRRALLKYALKQWGLDADHAARRLLDQQIVLFKREVVHEKHG